MSFTNWGRGKPSRYTTAPLMEGHQGLAAAYLVARLNAGMGELPPASQPAYQQGSSAPRSRGRR